MTHTFKYFSKWFLVILASLILVACGAKNTTEQAKSSASETKEITIKSASGEVTLTSQPKKIVVLDNGMADTLRALGYEDTIVGMPTDSLPSYLEDLGEKSSITNVGTLKEVNLETIDSLAPDLIIASGRTVGQMEEFQKIAPTVYFATDTEDYWGSVKTNITELAKLFGEEGEAKAATEIEKLEAEIKAVADKNADTKATALTVILNEGNMAGVAANGRYAMIYQTLGFQPTSLVIEESQRGGGRQGGEKDQKSTNTSSASRGSSEHQGGSGSHGAGLSFESVSEVNPDLIFVIDRSLAIGGDMSVNDAIMKNELIQATNAVQNDKIINLTADLWYLSGGGLESTHLMVKELASHAGSQ